MRFAEEVSKLSKQRLALLCVELQRELQAARQSRPEPIAIIGIGCRLPGSVNGPEEFWHLLENGVDAIGPVPLDRWNVDEVYDPDRNAPGKLYTRSGGFVDRVDEFDPEFFGISPREARHMDPQHRLLLEVAWEALEHAGQPIDQLSGSRTGVFMGIGTYDYATWQTAYLTHASINAYSGTGNAFCFAAGRLSYLLGLQGPSMSLDTACATSLVTLHLACQSLRAGECTLALAGGVNLMISPEPTIFLSKAQALSPDGRCKTFDMSADGYGRGEGCGIVVLKRLSDAITAGDPVLAVIRGSAVNHDGRSAGLTVPNGGAQQTVIREALAQAGVAPGDIGYVEAHGTGTALGDPIEIRALSAVLGRDRDPDHPLWIGSVKTNIGHLEVAAGVASLMKVALALQRRTIPPHLHYRQPNPHISLDEIPARIPVTAVPWPESRGARLAGVSSFGLSGTNAHVIVEEFQPVLGERADATADGGSRHVLTLSARDEWSLQALASAYERALAPGGMLDGIPLRDICYTASVRRSHHRHRWAALVSSADEARPRLAAFAAKESTDDPLAVPTRREHKLAFVFAGQGSQWWAMGRSLMAGEPVFLHAMEECDEIFRRYGDISILQELGREEAASRIGDTEIAQPALFALQVALVRLLASWGIHPDSVIGHSAGEVAAVHAAGVLTFEDAARLALVRGRVMQQATGGGSMAAVQLGQTDAAALAAQFPGRLSVAAINSPSSSVLSGDTDAMTSALAGLEARGIWHRILPVNYAFHSHQMWRLRNELIEGIGGLRPRAATIPIVSTVTGEDADGVTFDAQYWVRNLTDPVRFAAGIDTLAASRHDVFLEIGPQPVLRKAVVECLETAGCPVSVLSTLRRGVDEQPALLKTIASLYTLGVPVEWRAFFSAPARVVHLPRYPWHRRRLWLEPERVGPLASGNDSVPAAAQNESEITAPTESEVLDYVHELRWEHVDRQVRHAGSDEAGAWLMFADRGGAAQTLAEVLRARGETCELVFAASEGFAPPEDSHVIDPTSVVAFRDLLKSTQAAQPFRGMVYLWGLDAQIDDDVSARLVYGGLVNIVQASGPAGWRARQIWVVTRGCQPVSTSVTAEALAQAPLWGMVRTIPLELPGISCIGVDLDPREGVNTIGVLADDLQHWDGVDQIALRGGQRYLPRLHRCLASPNTRERHSIGGDATYLITGGTGALGLKVARWMIHEGARHLVLVSRSGLAPEAARVVDELRSAGADVRVLQGDVANRQDVARILEEIDRTSPPLRGIVHAAGINDIGFIERQPWEPFAAVFPSKVRGAWNLHTLTETHSLDFFVLFSSTAAVFGALGQANYSGANAFLDSLAHYRRSCGLPALAINWGPWAEVGMAAKLGEQVRRRWEAQGVRMMSPAHAVATLGYLMRIEAPQAVATSIDWPTFVRSYPQIERVSLFAAMRAENPARGEALDSAGYVDLRRQLAEAGPEEGRELMRDYVRRQFADALGFEPSHPLDPELNFLEMGVDSLVATRVMLVLNDALGLSLPVSLMFEHSTIATLGAEVDRLRIASAGQRPAGNQPARPVESSAPLSSAQQRLWFVNKFETDEPAYNEAVVLRVSGDLQLSIMAAALEEIVRRHETLRTVFRHEKDGPVQVVLPAAPVTLPVENLLAVPEPERDRQMRQMLSDEVRRPFDLSLGPLWRARLFHVRESEHVLALVLHHIITDGWSHGVLAREAMTLYQACSEGRPSPLPALPMQYRDYSRWQRQQLETERVQKQLKYWQERLAGLPVLEWPFVSGRRARQTFRGATHSFLVPRASAEELTALGQREGTTLFMTLLAAFFVLLHRHTRQSDFAVGTPVAGRRAAGTEPLIGLFLNLLVLRAKVDGGLTFRELLARARETSLEAFDHQDLPFDDLVDRMGVRRDLSRSPLFQVMFVLQNTPQPKLSVGDLSAEPIAVDRGTSKMDFTLTFEPTSRGLEGTVEYSTDLFDAPLMSAMMRHYQQILEGIIARPDQPVAELPLLTANERDQIVTTWNASAQVWPDPSAASLVGWLESQAARTPDAVAVWADEGAMNGQGTVWTYAELHARANQIARRLQRLGVGAESRVGVWLPRSAQMVAALIGVLKAGGAYVPLDPSYPPARLAFQVADAQVTVVLTSTEYAPAVPGAYAVEVLDAPGAAWRQEAETAPAVRLSPGQLAYVIYTSGSTGQPKGAMNSHRGIGNRLAWMQATYGLTGADRVLQKTSINFDVSVWELFLPLGTGATLVVARPGGQNDPAYLADVIERAGVTVMHFVPAMLEAFVTAGGLNACNRVRLIVCSGEALPGPLAARCMASWPGQLENLYGPTEAAVDVTWQPCTPTVTAAAIVPIGRPVANTQVYVRDAAGQPVPVGVVGELYLGGVQVGRGYWARPDLTADRFVPDPFSAIPGARLYRTGDLARYRSDGVVEYVGRVDQQVKLHGNRIELGEIEAVLRQQPGIRDAAVVLREDESGARRLVGYVVPAGPAGGLVIETLRQHLRARVPEYMVPAVIVALDALPLNPNGKVDRRALPEPDPLRPALGVEYMAPRNELEQLLADIEAEVLGLDRVGIHDNFFDIGGASLAGLEIMSRLNEAGIAVEPMQLFEHQTVAELAAAITEEEGERSKEADVEEGAVVHSSSFLLPSSS